MQFLKVNSLVCTFILVCLLWSASKSWNMKILHFFDRIFFRIHVSDFRYFVSSRKIWMNEITCCIEQTQLKIRDHWLSIWTANKTSSVIILFWMCMQSFNERKKHWLWRIAIMLTLSSSWSVSLFLTICIHVFLIWRK